MAEIDGKYVDNMDKLPFRYEAVQEFIQFLPGKVVEADIRGGRFSLAGVRYTHKDANLLNGSIEKFRILYNFAEKKFYALRLSEGDQELWLEI